MSFYLPTIKTHLLDPVYHNSSPSAPRTEFRIPANKAILNNMRLAGVGCLSNNANASYPALNGIFSLVKNVYLTDGKAQIDVRRDVNRNACLLTLRNSNSKSFDIEKRKRGTRLGFNSLPLLTTDADPLSTVDNSNKAQTTASATYQGWISLSELLPFFSGVAMSNPVLPAFSTALYQELKLVIEWNSAPGTLAPSGATPNAVTSILQPLLIFDEIMGPKGEQFMSSYKGCQFMCYESDRVQLKEITTSGTNQTPAESVSYNIDAFRSKYVDSLTWQVVGNTQQPTQTAPSYSQPLFREQLAVNLNGKSLFPWVGGVNGYNTKLGLATQTLGELNMCHGMQLPVPNLQASVINQGSNADLLQSTASVGAFSVKSVVDTLNITHTRSGLFDADELSQLCYVYYTATIPKAVVSMGNGNYEVQYTNVA
jgi:hypothetical protein